MAHIWILTHKGVIPPHAGRFEQKSWSYFAGPCSVHIPSWPSCWDHRSWHSVWAGQDHRYILELSEAPPTWRIEIRDGSLGNVTHRCSCQKKGA
jgi:hypothetical protein